MKENKKSERRFKRNRKKIPIDFTVKLMCHGLWQYSWIPDPDNKGEYIDDPKNEKRVSFWSNRPKKFKSKSKTIIYKMMRRIKY